MGSNNNRLETFSLDQWNKEIQIGLTGALIVSQETIKNDKTKKWKYN